MENIIRSIYLENLNTINNSPESKINYFEGQIHEFKQFITLYQDEMIITNNQDEKDSLQEEIESLQDEIIKTRNIIESIRNGNTEITIRIENVETNMK